MFHLPFRSPSEQKKHLIGEMLMKNNALILKLYKTARFSSIKWISLEVLTSLCGQIRKTSSDSSSSCLYTKQKSSNKTSQAKDETSMLKCLKS